MVSLNEAGIGSEIIIKRVETEPALRQRLFDIGLIPETVVRVLHQSPCGNPRAYLVRGAVIALRNADTGKIFGEVISDG